MSPPSAAGSGLVAMWLGLRLPLNLRRALSIPSLPLRPTPTPGLQDPIPQIKGTPISHSEALPAVCPEPPLPIPQVAPEQCLTTIFLLRWGWFQELGDREMSENEPLSQGCGLRE